MDTPEQWTPPQRQFKHPDDYTDPYDQVTSFPRSDECPHYRDSASAAELLLYLG